MTVADVVQGIATGDNDRFVRFVWEVSNDQWSLVVAQRRWVPFEKGGGYGKWVGHQHWSLDWGNEGSTNQRARRGHIFRMKKLYFSSQDGPIVVLLVVLWFSPVTNLVCDVILSLDLIARETPPKVVLAAHLNARMASASVRWIRPQSAKSEIRFTYSTSSCPNPRFSCLH